MREKLPSFLSGVFLSVLAANAAFEGIGLPKGMGVARRRGAAHIVIILLIIIIILLILIFLTI